MNKKQLLKIENEIKKIKMKLMKFHLFRPGSITQQYRSSDKKKVGFYHLSYSHHGKGRTNYVRKEFFERIKKQTLDYKEVKKLIDRWIELGIEHSKISIKLELKEKK